MRIKIISDIHFEFLPKLKSNWVINIIKKNSDILVLAGDIGYPDSYNYKDFLINMNSMFQRIYLIAGNHEYYSKKSMDTNINIIRKIIKENNLTNIKFLSNEYEDYQGYRFIGSTLWSKILNPDYLINDFDQIPNLTPTIYNELHNECIDFITKTLDDSKEKNIPVIMITHHLPSLTLNDSKYKKYSNYNQCFSSELDYLIHDPIILWIYGHTHTTSDKIINGIRMVCNPIGYPNENHQSNFNLDIDITTLKIL